MIELYVSETCPYCRKVMDFMEKESIRYDKKDVSEPENLQKLLELGGMAQVPFLYDKDYGSQMYESDDIIKYLTTRC